MKSFSTEYVSSAAPNSTTHVYVPMLSTPELISRLLSTVLARGPVLRGSVFVYPFSRRLSLNFQETSRESPPPVTAHSSVIASPTAWIIVGISVTIDASANRYNYLKKYSE